jgi:hypothetical protein
MPNRTAILTQSELTRYAKALAAADVVEWRVVVRPDGSHEIIVGGASSRGNRQILGELDKAAGIR